MNKVILIGRLVADPEMKNTASGKWVANYRIAVDRRFKTADDTQGADFFNVVAWERNAEFVHTYLKKGTKIALEGRLSSRTYKDKDDKTVYVVEVIAENHEFCEKKEDSPQPATPNRRQTFADIPRELLVKNPAEQPAKIPDIEDFIVLEDDDEVPF
jgi:single-strand DNA-binding protein